MSKDSLYRGCYNFDQIDDGWMKDHLSDDEPELSKKALQQLQEADHDSNTRMVLLVLGVLCPVFIL